jgi:hypothetical protein
MTALFCVLVAALAGVEDQSVETKSFDGVKLVIVDNVDGPIQVTGRPGTGVQMEVRKHINAETPERLEAARREVKLDIQQSGDSLKLFVDGPFRCNGKEGSVRSGHQGYNVTYDFKLSVPRDARVDLYTVNHGNIVVQSVDGDFDIRNVNGLIDMTDVAGSGKARTVNGPVKVLYSRNPAGPLEFETVNGNVDVAFRKGFGARARMQTMNGGMYTDFEVQPEPSEAAVGSRENGKLVIRNSRSTAVRLGSGGPDVRLKTLNGDIFIRDREKQ